MMDVGLDVGTASGFSIVPRTAKANGKKQLNSGDSAQDMASRIPQATRKVDLNNGYFRMCFVTGG